MTAPHRIVESLPRAKEPARVIVIGAGMAGLCAALELKEAGCEVLVLEARNRAGGRVRTRRDFPEGLYIEEGATRFPDVHHLTMHYINRFALPLITFNRPDNGDVLRIMGQDVESHPWHQDDWPAQLPLHQHERAMTLAELTDFYLTPLWEELGDPLEPGWPGDDVHRRWDDIDYATMLRSRGASEGAIHALSLGFHVGNGPESVSALWWREAMALDSDSRVAYKIAGGNDLLADAFLSQLGDDVRFGCHVQRLEQDSSGVTVYFDTPSGSRQAHADFAVCTLPLPLLAGFDFEPALPTEQREAFATVPYATLSRVALQCRERFWLERNRSGFEHTDELIAELWDLTTGEPGKRGVLVAYTGGEEAAAVTAMSPEERVHHTIKQLETLLPELDEYVEAGTSMCWDEDPLALGGGAWYRPGQRHLRELLPLPHGRVHFAGEGTSIWPGWVQGAFESGRRATREIVEVIGV